MANEPAVVGTYGDPIAAHLARARLDSEGIQSFVLDEHLLAIHPLIAGAIGGIKVVVHSADAAAANAILGRRVAPAQAACPECGSARIKARHVGRRSAFLTVLLLGIPIGRARSKFRCEDCRHTWRE